MSDFDIFYEICSKCGLSFHKYRYFSFSADESLCFVKLTHDNRVSILKTDFIKMDLDSTAPDICYDIQKINTTLSISVDESVKDKDIHCHWLFNLSETESIVSKIQEGITIYKNFLKLKRMKAIQEL